MSPTGLHSRRDGLARVPGLEALIAPLGGSLAAQGALAGILGATALGLVAPAFGGTNRLITAPCAPDWRPLG